MLRFNLEGRSLFRSGIAWWLLPHSLLLWGICFLLYPTFFVIEPLSYLPSPFLISFSLQTPDSFAWSLSFFLPSRSISTTCSASQCTFVSLFTPPSPLTCHSSPTLSWPSFFRTCSDMSMSVGGRVGGGKAEKIIVFFPISYFSFNNLSTSC